ncbi:MAG: cyclase family protein, partial [Gammaproteobacteria bacterium]
MKKMNRLVVVTMATAALLSQVQAANEPTSQADIERWMTELSNWGRWGEDDQLGAANLITPAKRKQAAGLVKAGVSVSLARDPRTEKAIDNPNPYEHTMLRFGEDETATGSGDVYSVSYHGLAH